MHFPAYVQGRIPEAHRCIAKGLTKIRESDEISPVPRKVMQDQVKHLSIP